MRSHGAEQLDRGLLHPGLQIVRNLPLGRRFVEIDARQAFGGVLDVPGRALIGRPDGEIGNAGAAACLRIPLAQRRMLEARHVESVLEIGLRYWPEADHVGPLLAPCEA